jgi:diguanylate cyclase (GGDEF)-like protein
MTDPASKRGMTTGAGRGSPAAADPSGVFVAGRYVSAEARALRVGATAGLVFFAASILWDVVVAPELWLRLLWVRGFGVVAMGSVVALSFALPQRARVIAAVATTLSGTAVCAAVPVLPYGFGYGVGGMLCIFLTMALICRDGRNAVIGGALTVLAGAVTLLGYRVPADTLFAMGFFCTFGFAAAVTLSHYTGVRRARERGVREGMAAFREDLARFGSTDALTGVPDGRQLMSLARRELALARRRKSALSALKIDVHQLDGINLRYGRPAGDETLRAVASMCQAELRETDLLARLGGEDFAAVLPEADENGAQIICDRLTKTFEKARVLAGEQVVQVTVNVATATLNDTDKTLDDLLRRADDSLRSRKTAAPKEP